ncbi:hypothetical protein [Noviherbaspirillum sp. UKPF54]|uniref:hypothetical protein n=1 Tax=Noviherbaspirillum sp. UKPF54 TaxID=2601898 RepID=UPI0011B16A6C|nr:hypothetical protein [Noviherbaspirillum sp. UKPF54]QDZ27828.1 hypothetical protein FAY22_07615 [Noviherbaspirillum sp. UKPF54]
MSILDTVFRRREPAVKYRTIDGGHPAPYPDMTDEQLYNYEMTFNVPKKTFDKPPGGPAATSDATGDAIGAGGTVLHGRADAGEPNVTALRTAGRQSATGRGQGRTRTGSPHVSLAQSDSDPEVTRTLATERIAAAQPPAPLDLSKPVRTITTKQPVEIVTTRARHPLFKVLGYIGDDEVVTMFTLDGQISENGPCFLENVPQKQSLYVNIYPNRSFGGRERFFLTQHDSREAADAAATGERIACIPLEFDL